MSKNHEVFDAYIDDEGYVCYRTENHVGEWCISPELFKFTVSTPYMGRLDIFHTHFPNVLIVSMNMEHNYPEFMEDMAYQVAYYIENYC